MLNLIIKSDLLTGNTSKISTCESKNHKWMTISAKTSTPISQSKKCMSGTSTTKSSPIMIKRPNKKLKFLKTNASVSFTAVAKSNQIHPLPFWAATRYPTTAVVNFTLSTSIWTRIMNGRLHQTPSWTAKQTSFRTWWGKRITASRAISWKWPVNWTQKKSGWTSPSTSATKTHDCTKATTTAHMFDHGSMNTHKINEQGSIRTKRVHKFTVQTSLNTRKYPTAVEE